MNNKSPTYIVLKAVDSNQKSVQINVISIELKVTWNFTFDFGNFVEYTFSFE